jgi:hypothetical protein
MEINWFAVTIIFMWGFAAIGSAYTRNHEPFNAVLFATIIMGIGYFILHKH